MVLDFFCRQLSLTCSNCLFLFSFHPQIVYNWPLDMVKILNLPQQQHCNNMFFVNYMGTMHNKLKNSNKSRRKDSSVPVSTVNSWQSLSESKKFPKILMYMHKWLAFKHVACIFHGLSHLASASGNWDPDTQVLNTPLNWISFVNINKTNASYK